MSNKITLQPGFMVALHTRVEGGVHYDRRDLAAETGAAFATTDAKVEKWETTKVTDDAEEHARAVKVRSGIRGLVEKVCIRSPFGLLCPRSREEELREAIAAGRASAQEFNATATTCSVGFWSMVGQIVEDDSEASRAIAGEIRSLLAEMDAGIEERDAEKIREAARKATQIQEMLDEEHAGYVSAAVKEAREAAREIVATVKKRGTAADAILAADSEAKRARMRAARFAFLDVDSETEAVDIPVVAARALDVDDDAGEDDGSSGAGFDDGTAMAASS